MLLAACWLVRLCLSAFEDFLRLLRWPGSWTRPGLRHEQLSQKAEYGTVYARDLEWFPIGNQAATFADAPPRVVHPDIVIAKLRPGQVRA